MVTCDVQVSDHPGAFIIATGGYSRLVSAQSCTKVLITHASSPCTCIKTCMYMYMTCVHVWSRYYIKTCMYVHACL